MAFSLVRFRSLPGTSKEILSVFFVITVGLATGMGHLLFVLIITIMGCFSLLVFSKVSLFDQNKKSKLLKIIISENLDYTEVFNDIFTKYTTEVKLEQVKTTNMGSMFEITYCISLNDDINEKFIDELRVKNGNLKIILTHPLEESDL